MKVTLHAGKGHAAHNDRTENMFSKDEHIDTERSSNNTYWCWDDSSEFYQSEKNFYALQYDAWLKDVKEKAEKSRHKERIKTVAALLNGARTQPSEIILQIGDINDAVSKDMLNECVHDFLSYLSQYEHNLHILDYAIHADEATTHCHIRAVYDYIDERGICRISKDNALHEMGFSADENLPDGRFNNASVQFLNTLRDEWMGICEEHGIIIDKDIDKTNQRHMPVKEFRDKKEQEALRRLATIAQKVEAEKAALSKLQEQVKDTKKEQEAREHTVLSLQQQIDGLTKIAEKAEEKAGALEEKNKRLEEEAEQLAAQIREYQAHEQRQKERKQKKKEEKVQTLDAMMSMVQK